MNLPILYCHGLLGTQEEGDALRRQFESTSAWYSFNFMGHGGNPQTEEWSIENFSDNLVAFARENKLIDPIVVGYSLGGYVALYAAMQQKLIPKYLICYGTKWFWDLDFVNRENIKMNVQYLAEKAPGILEKWRQLHYPVSVEDMLERARKFMERMAQSNHWNKEKLSELDIELVICQGELDTFISKEDNLAMQKLVKNTRLVTLPNSGHSARSIDVNELSKCIGDTCRMNNSDN